MCIPHPWHLAFRGKLPVGREKVRATSDHPQDAGDTMKAGCKHIFLQSIKVSLSKQAFIGEVQWRAYGKDDIVPPSKGARLGVKIEQFHRS